MSARLRKRHLAGAAACAVAAFAAATLLCLNPIHKPLPALLAERSVVTITDRHGLPLTASYQDSWNSDEYVSLHEIPAFLKTAFLVSEDRRFFEHRGVDWQARAGAFWQNAKKGEINRGASTITEQVVRMVNPRPRTLWSKWLEGIEAALLERRASKGEILEFYLNELPYAANRRGVTQAARYYFSRDISTLTQREMLALAVLARAPGSYDLYRHPERIDKGLARLAAALRERGALNAEEAAAIARQKIAVVKPSLPVEARHFARYARQHALTGKTRLVTTLDAGLQEQVQNILDQRLRTLSGRHVKNAAILVADHENGDILAWAVAGARDSETPGGDIDAVTVPRQPGSALKPFLYTMALEKGWTPATLLDDSPLAEAVGPGLHRFRNYSNVNYGPITLREALGNSLNIPAVLAIRHVGVKPYLETLRRLGFASLNRDADIYDEGLALGNGEVSLYELVQGYTALANRGLYKPLRVTAAAETPEAVRIYSPEAVSLIGNILSDPTARALEFGSNSVLNLPSQTAAKTGTATDYRDAWAVGYNDRFTVGIWMGNLDHSPTEGLTGSTGPALALRSVFAELNRNRDTRKLYFSPLLVSADVCTRPMTADGACPRRTEWFMPGTVPSETPQAALAAKPSYELVRPTEGLQIAYDPRIPQDSQKFRFEIKGMRPGDRAEWRLDGAAIAQTTESIYLWPVSRGRHDLSVSIFRDGDGTKLVPVRFMVK